MIMTPSGHQVRVDESWPEVFKREMFWSELNGLGHTRHDIPANARPGRTRIWTREILKRAAELIQQGIHPRDVGHQMGLNGDTLYTYVCASGGKSAFIDMHLGEHDD